MGSCLRFFRDDRGATAIEYALLSSLIAIFIIAAVATVGSNLSSVYSEVGNALK